MAVVHLMLYTTSRRPLTRMLEDCGYVVVESSRTCVYSLYATPSRGVELQPSCGSIAARVARTLRLDGLRLPLYFGDLFTIYARRTQRVHVGLPRRRFESPSTVCRTGLDCAVV
ncbi:MAG: hypothetical protein WKH64_09125 [Chloroflexia bacterium]